MKPKWTWVLAAIGLGLVLAALGGAYGFIRARSQSIVDASYPKPASLIHASRSAEAVARGAHLAVVTACIGCHGADLTGQAMGVSGSVIETPNLTLAAGRLSDADLDRAIRRGLRPDGHSELAMPSQAYASLTDADVAALVGYLRTLPPRGADSPPPRIGLMLRATLALGVVKTEAAKLALAKPPRAAGAAVEPGRYLAAIACGQCHGGDLGGGQSGPGPDLTVRGYYDRDQFRTLMKTGVSDDGRDLDLMSDTARRSFSHFTDAEIDAIYDYLVARDRVLSAAASRRAAS